MSVSEIFVKFEEYLELDIVTREGVVNIVRKISQGQREIAKLLQSIHQTRDKEKLSECTKKCRDIFNDSIRHNFKSLEEFLLEKKVPSTKSYAGEWYNVVQNLCFQAALVVFLENEKFAPYEEIASILNLKTEKTAFLPLNLEDYLMGQLFLASELSRLAVNSVTMGDNNLPLIISKFMTELAAGFRLISFKNDYLRTRYDVLKYDVKKVEEVVYDLSLRGLVNTS